MATRRLDRTAIEGGRVQSCRYSERQETRSERHQAKVLVRDLEVEYIEPRRGAWERDFADKIRPVERWLRSRVGCPWDDVYAEVKARFDTRTTPGRHIVEGHILQMVARSWEPRSDYADFLVDDAGILRLGRPRRTRSRRREPELEKPLDEAALRDFLGGRVVGVDPDGSLRGFECTRPRGEWTEACYGNCNLPATDHRIEEHHGRNVRIHRVVEWHYRQGRLLGLAEAKIWKALPRAQREAYEKK